MKGPIRILIAEDLPTDADLAEREIKKAIANPEFRRVETEEDFVEALENFQPHLVVSDYQMPKFNGMRALQITLEKTPLTPLIILTGSMNEETAVECMKAGATDYVIKEHVMRLGPAVKRALELKEIRLERLNARQALIESEERFRCLIESSNDGISLLDLDDNIVFVNQRKVEMLGYASDKDLIGVNGFSILVPHERNRFQELQQEFLAKGHLNNIETELVRRDGSSLPVELNFMLIKDLHGKPLYVMDTIRDITERKQTEEELKQYEWILEQNIPQMRDEPDEFRPVYGDVTELGGKGIIINSVGREGLASMAEDVMALLDTSLAVYEANGDYAYGVFKSGWCRMMDEASFKLCGTEDTRKALVCGKWHCHENCWNDSAKAAIRSGKPTDIECVGGINLYAVPVYANNEVVGVVNIGYGNPPKDPETLQLLSEKYQIDYNLLQSRSAEYNPRPDFIIELGKKRCHFMARLIGEIIERKQFENLLEQSKYLLEIAGNLAKLGGWSVNLEENIVIWSDQVAAIHEMPAGYSPTVEEGINFYAPEYRDRITDLYTACAQAGVPYDEELQIITAEGRRVWVRAIGEAIRNDGKITGVQGGFQDITQRKLAEKELQLAKERAEAGDRLKSAFMNNISHEIRTPLNGILGFGQMMAQSGLAEAERTEYFKILQKSTDRLINTINDYMDISLLVSGNLTINNRKFNVNDLLNNLYERVLPDCVKKDLELELLFPDSSQQAIVDSDLELLRKVFLHLLNNAVKFTGKGKITFGYELVGKDIEFFVGDTGVGIDQRALAKVFEAFTQEEENTSRNYDGSGLGLSIAKGIISSLGGKIWLESEKGKGTIVNFTLPYIETIPQEPDKQDAKSAPALAKQAVVLVVEDEISNYYYLHVLLKKLSISVLHAKNGLEAVELCKKHPEINVVLMDIKMPVMGGLEATKKIKEFRKDLPVIAITAYAQTGDEFRIRQAGCDDYLAKPLKKEVLINVLRKYNLLSR